MIRLGILSDSHLKDNLTYEAVEMLKSKGVKYLVHAGDLQMKENLEILKNSGLIYVSVFGNNDWQLTQYTNEYKIYNEPYYFKIQDVKFKLMHIPNYLTPDSDIVIFGHTHKFEVDYKGDTLYLNPGEICAREKNLTEAVVLTITDKEYKVEYNYKEPTQTIWQTKEFVFAK